MFLDIISGFSTLADPKSITDTQLILTNWLPFVIMIVILTVYFLWIYSFYCSILRYFISPVFNTSIALESMDDITRKLLALINTKNKTHKLSKEAKWFLFIELSYNMWYWFWVIWHGEITKFKSRWTSNTVTRSVNVISKLY